MGLCTPDRMEKLRELALSVPRGVIGEFVEVGVYTGDSLRLIAECAGNSRWCWGFDTWEGLPACQWQEDEWHNPGEFSYPFDSCRNRLKDAPNVTLVQGVAPESMRVIADRKIAFAHLDVDFYLGTRLCLEWLIPRMSPGSILVLDDMDWPRTPGVRKAVEECGLTAEPAAMYQAFVRF